MVNDPSRPRRLTLPASRRKACFAFILSLPCCLVGWWYAVARDPWLGWCGVAFFGMGGVVSLLLLIFPGFWALELAEDGFRMRSLFGTTFIRWQDVSGFDVASISMNMMIVFNFAPTYAGKKFGRMVASDLTGWEGGLPDIYGIPPAELAALLNEWKRRSIPAARSSDG